MNDRSRASVWIFFMVTEVEAGASETLQPCAEDIGFSGCTGATGEGLVCWVSGNSAVGFTPGFGDVAGGTTECSVGNYVAICVSWGQTVALAPRGLAGLFIWDWLQPCGRADTLILSQESDVWSCCARSGLAWKRVLALPILWFE